MDVMTPDQRYRAMANNRGRTQPERMLASSLWKHGLRYLTHEGYVALTGERLFGKPDLVFPRKKIVIFVDGCFWHGCSKCGKRPEQSGQFWIDKIDANRKRDGQVTASLENNGWTVLRIPEHKVHTKATLLRTVECLVPRLQTSPGGINQVR